jgi:hypothetical protein
MTDRYCCPCRSRCTKQEGNGAPGVILTIVLTIAIMMISLFLFYNYLLHVHMNGRSVSR